MALRPKNTVKGCNRSKYPRLRRAGKHFFGGKNRFSVVYVENNIKHINTQPMWKDIEKSINKNFQYKNLHER